ncbi:MAG: D-alanyl-D-alanine carboxypeptidase/D-alanyl-D-alanine endopeptidase [Bacteroidales bacterium]
MKTKRIILIFLAFWYFYFLALGGGYSLPFNQAGGSYAFKVVDVETSKVIAEYDSERMLIPASIAKLLTTATVLDIYGPEWRFQTSLYINGEIVDGVLNGDIVVRSNGDPTLGSRHFAYNTPEKLFLTWSQSLLKVGIKSIKGRVIIDNSLYGREVIPSKWLWEDMGNYYAAGVWCVNVFDNRYTLDLESGSVGSRPIIKSVTPYVESLIFENSLVSASNSKDSAYIYGVPMDNSRKIYGSLPANRKSFKISGDIPNPAMLFGDLLIAFLNDRGLRVHGSAIVNYDALDLIKSQPIHIHYSPKLSEICRVVNVVSHNLFADALMRLIAQKGSSNPTFQIGVANMKRHWSDKGVDVGPLMLYDGSGLSPSNRLSPDLLIDILLSMSKKSTNFSSFLSSMPIGGVDRSEFRGTNLDRRVRLKSGTMGGVRCYSGYIEGKSGKRYAFVFMANDLQVSSSEMRKRFEGVMSNVMLDL